MVWQVFGSFDAMVLMSSEKPMSSMRSASSRMKKLTLLRSTLPREIWEMRRPGVAMTTSAPMRRLRNS
ncbi:Uncharacterised protein [Segatella copri]|nr:Uncharacterised protein [Segatella copri]